MGAAYATMPNFTLTAHGFSPTIFTFLTNTIFYFMVQVLPVVWYKYCYYFKGNYFKNRTKFESSFR